MANIVWTLKNLTSSPIEETSLHEYCLTTIFYLATHFLRKMSK